MMIGPTNKQTNKKQIDKQTTNNQTNPQPTNQPTDLELCFVFGGGKESVSVDDERQQVEVVDDTCASICVYVSMCLCMDTW